MNLSSFFLPSYSEVLGVITLTYLFAEGKGMDTIQPII